MYEVRKGDAVAALTEKPNFIYQHPDGYFVLCEQEQAQGVAVDGTAYHLSGKPEMEGCETVLLVERDAGDELMAAMLRTAETTRLSGQMKVATRLVVRDNTDITDEEALEMPELFRTWKEALDEGKQLQAQTVLNKDGKLYRVVQPVTPLESQPPDAAGMLAIYRPIDIEHAGTEEDPIPFLYGMDTVAGKYYTYEGKLYLCNQSMTACVWAPGTEGMWQWTEVQA